MRRLIILIIVLLLLIVSCSGETAEGIVVRKEKTWNSNYVYVQIDGGVKKIKIETDAFAVASIGAFCEFSHKVVGCFRRVDCREAK